MPASLWLFVREGLPDRWHEEIVRRAQVDELDGLEILTTEEHVLWLQVSVDDANPVELLHLEADVVEHVSHQVILQKAKAAAVLPDLVLALEHLVEKIEIEVVLERRDQPDRGHGALVLLVVVGVSDLVEGMLLHVDVVLALQGVHTFYFAHLQGKMPVLELQWIDLEDLCEVAVAQFADDLKHVGGEGFVIGMLLDELFWINSAELLVRGPVLPLAFH